MEKYVKFVKFKNMETLKMMLALVFFLMTGINAKATSDKTSMESKSQNDSYMPFLADGKSWLVGTPDGKVYGYYVDGETTIGSRLCKKVMERRIVPQGDNSSYHCAIYEEDGKVWLFRSGMTEPELLYDFKAEAGDVGCMNGLLYPDHPNNYYTPYWDFISCTTPGGETVTRDEIYGEAVPYEEVFPPEDIHLPESSSNATNQIIYNLYGIKVVDNAADMKTLPRGIYIVNGKKMVVK